MIRGPSITGASCSSSFAQTLSAIMSEIGDTFILTPTEELVGNPLLPALHGGAVASFLELAANTPWHANFPSDSPRG